MGRAWVVAALIASACEPRPIPPGLGGGETGTDDTGDNGGDDGCAGLVCDADVPADDPPGCEPPGESGRTPRHAECNLWLQDCDEGFKCSIWAEANTAYADWIPRCVPVPAGAVGVGKPCTVSDTLNLGCDDCEAGTMCWNVDEQTLVGRCVAYCEGVAYDPLCVAGTTCVGRDGWSFDVCLERCDPLAQQCSGQSEGCYRVDDQFACFPTTFRGEHGDACTEDPDCKPGLSCVDVHGIPGCAGTGGCCSPYCDLDEAAPCPDPDLECISPFAPAKPPDGHEHVGSCALPG